MKMTTNKKYVLYYNYLEESYSYRRIYDVNGKVKFWSKKFPVMYSDSLKIIELTIINLNK